jgi:uncharacterized OB-fold protein
MHYNTSLARIWLYEMERARAAASREYARVRRKTQAGADGWYEDLASPAGLGVLTPLPHCPQCGAAHAPEAKRCRKCGVRFSRQTDIRH